jgi:hypothetical protein
LEICAATLFQRQFVMDRRATAPLAMVGTDRRAVRGQMIGAPCGRALPKTADENRQAERLP